VAKFWLIGVRANFLEAPLEEDSPEPVETDDRVSFYDYMKLQERAVRVEDASGWILAACSQSTAAL
jgi:hypothetical protein